MDAVQGYRNGYGKKRHLTLSCGTVVLKRPRLRGREQLFVSKILPLFVRRAREVGDLLAELCLHGEGDFDLALSRFVGRCKAGRDRIQRRRRVPMTWQVEGDKSPPPANIARELVCE